MKTKQKELYRAPETEALEIKTEGVICTSGEVTSTMDGIFMEETI